ncbi:MAG: hypothetical protein OXI91_08060 [Chloroflexota bacterium]|nr:hypothetical protein [Chloroflexota bacterium]
MTQGGHEAYPDLALAWRERNGRDALQATGWAETELAELQGPDGDALNRRLALLTSEALQSGNEPDGSPDTDRGPGRLLQSPPGSSLPVVAGRFEVADGAVWFVPRFPFVAGMGYALLVYPSSGAGIAAADGTRQGPRAWDIQRPAVDATPVARVVAIYPDVDEVPVNLLKFYVHFSEPMSEGRAQRAISVCRDDTGEPIDGVFVPMDPELWDGARQRLTLLLDPARIKHGLVPNMEVGYPLIEGVPFRLRLGPEFRDAKGRPMAAGAERRYAVGPEVRERVDPAKWSLTVPDAGTLHALKVGFDRPLDHALLQRSLGVSGPEGEPVAGKGSTGPNEKSWQFEPELPWAEGRHRLVVGRQLEDLAGNSPLRVFDRDMTEADDGPDPADLLSADFTCAAG